ncbi:MAG: hypothetical protein OXH69_09805 [Acidobacteria bacterium]|nr:hypothetical protein [Acidobacteriota bacterium]
MTVPVAIGLDDGIVRAVWQAGSRVATVRGRLPWTGSSRGDGSSPVALCRLVVRRDRPAAAGRAVVRRRPPGSGPGGIRSTFGLSSAKPALEEDPDDDSDVLEHAGGTRWRMLVGMGADVAFGGLQTAYVDTTMKAAA